MDTADLIPEAQIEGEAGGMVKRCSCMFGHDVLTRIAPGLTFERCTASG